MSKGDNFIKKYIDFKDESEVIVGGVSYAEYEQLEKQTIEVEIRWYREERKAHFRNQRPYASFSACNLFIKRKLSEYRFTESLTKYGHEDTLYGAELEFNSYTVMHINNPIIHLGIDEVSIFLEKTEFALINLLALQKSHPRACKNIKIFNYYNFIRKTLFLTKGIFIFWKYCCRKLLMNGSTNLMVFDLYKLSFMLCLKKN